MGKGTSEVQALAERVARLEALAASDAVNEGALSKLAVSASIRAKLALAGLMSLDDLHAFNEADLMKFVGLRRTDARRVRAALKNLSRA